MTVIFESGYSLPGGDEPLTHARIAHANNWITGGTPGASTTDADFFVDGPDNILTYERWKPTALPATWENDFGPSSGFDYVCIGAHTMGTNGNTLEVQKFDSGAWTDLIPATAITSDSPIFCIFTPETDTKARIRITNGTVPEVGVVKVGTALQLERPLYGGHSPLELSRQPEMRTNTSMTGEFLGRTKQRMFFKTTFNWKNLTAQWVRDNWRTFQIAMETEPFFIAWRPEAGKPSANDVGLCYVDSMAVPSNQGVRDLMGVDLQVTGYGYD